jgi:ribokinase
MDLRAAVVGHVEWVQFLRVPKLPRQGEIVHSLDHWEEAAGGGPAAAVQLLKLAGTARILTALGDDEIGRAASARLAELGLEVHARTRSDEVTRRAVTFVDDDGERTITVIGDRLNPSGTDPLPWESLEEIDACYFTAGDAGALRAARRSRVLVGTARVASLLADAGVKLDAVIGSAVDPSEPYRHGDIEPIPMLAARTEGERGGSYSVDGGDWLRYEAVAPTEPVIDRYGAGDSFAAGLAFGLAAGLEPADAVDLAARCGAAVVTGRGPYARQLSYAQVADLLPTTPAR